MNSSFVFIDIEWEQLGKRPSAEDLILEIGATKLEADTRFISYIKHNKKIDRRIRKLLNIKQPYIKGITLNQAMASLKEYVVGEVRTVVIWSGDARDKLEILARKYKCTFLLKNVIVLQDLIQKLSEREGSIAFDNALIAMGAKYEKAHMHNAYFDATCLKDLYIKIVEKYIELNPILADGVYVCSNSKKYHLDNCIYCRDTENIKKIHLKEAINKEPCKRCASKLNPLVMNIDSSKEIKRIKKIYSYQHKPVSCEMMYEIANLFGLNITGGLNVATISTGYSYWQVYCDNNGYVERVKHENYKSRDKSGRGFHDHNAFPKDVFSLFEYIKQHDDTTDITPIADSLIKKQKKKDKKKRMQKERRRYERDEWEEYYT